MFITYGIIPTSFLLGGAQLASQDARNGAAAWSKTTPAATLSEQLCRNGNAAISKVITDNLNCVGR